MNNPDPIDLWLYRISLGLVAVSLPFLLWALTVLFLSIFQ